LIDYLCASATGWTIAQKQTGCDQLSIGGAVSANVHGRGLKMKPFINDVISFDLVDAQGEIQTCSRTQNADLFRLVAGGYGLFGIIVSATIKLVRRTMLQRVVEIVDCTELMQKFDERIAMGCAYGDFQFAIDERSDDFLRKGVLSTYLPVETAEASDNVALSTDQWRELLYLAHTDKQKAFDVYASHYKRTNGQVYTSDRFQLATYMDGYHKELDARMCAEHPATEIITEIYVPRAALSDFLLDARDALRANAANVIYGTVRLIEQDDESFLAWAKQNFACIIFNLHTEHTDEGKDRSAKAFRALIDLAIGYGGSYYLTYHRFAGREQLTQCYPQFEDFIAAKRRYDPCELFSSNWYRHYTARASETAD
jgi:FAD/FMN-containing dehydrogenase